MHYDFEYIKEHAEDVGNGYSRFVLELEKGDTAYAPGTTKYHILAHGDGAKVEYTIHAMSVEGYTSGPVCRSLIDPRG